MKSLALYAGAPWRVRLHTRIRARTAPLLDLVARLPSEGRLLEVGCGHGLFANEAALRHPRLSVLGVDPDADKIRWAQQAAGGRDNVRFRHAGLAELTEDGFDVLALVDVLYLVPRSDWPTFLEACRARLRKGGMLLLKDVDTRPWWKFYRCVLQETVSVRLLGLTLGGSFAFASKEEMFGVLLDAGFDRIETTRLDRGYLTPHVLYRAVRP